MKPNIVRSLLSWVPFFLIGYPYLLFSNINPTIEQAIINLELNTALQLCQDNKGKFNEFYYNHILFYKYILFNNIVDKKKLKENTELLLKKYLIHDKDSLKYFLLSELYLKQAVLALFEGDKLSVLLGIKRAWQFNQRLNEEFPKSKLKHRVGGTLNLILSNVPNPYKEIAKGLGYVGNYSLGLNLLLEASKNDYILNFESTIILYYIFKNYLKDNIMAIKTIEQLKFRFPNSPLVEYYFIVSKIDQYELNSSITLIKTLPKASFLKLPQLFYLKGRLLSYDLQYDSAQKAFSDFLINTQTPINRIDAQFRLQMLKLLTQKNIKETVLTNFNTILDYENPPVFDEDWQAVNQIRHYLNNWPNFYDLELYKARLLFDGGKFDKSIQLIEKFINSSDLTIYQALEANYRLARNYHLKKDYINAVLAYKKCVNFKKVDNPWMQVYAFYYLGVINEILRNISIAKENYNKTKDFNGYSYQQGLELKVNAALARFN